MKRIFTAGGLAAALLFALACSGSTTVNTSVNTGATNSNSANRPANANAASPAASNTANASNTASSANTAASPAAQGAMQDFTVVNSTGVEINALYVSPHDADDWEEDVLGRDTLPAGQSVDIKFDRDEKAAMWDLRVEDSQGNSIVWENLDLLKISKLTLHYENGKATAEAE